MQDEVDRRQHDLQVSVNASVELLALGSWVLQDVGTDNLYAMLDRVFKCCRSR